MQVWAIFNAVCGVDAQFGASLDNVVSGVEAQLTQVWTIFNAISGVETQFDVSLDNF